MRLDQVDGTTCGSAVLIALAAWADPAEMLRLDGEQTATAERHGATAGAQAGVATGFGARYDARQQAGAPAVHDGSGRRRWARRRGGWSAGCAGTPRAPGPYRVRLVDDASAADVDDALAEAGAALAAARPVPLLVGSLVPRHYALALGVLGDGRWRVYEPTSGHVRALDLRLVRERRLAPVLGFDRLHALLLPA